mmetsp:Transcript_34576/g.62193  ORF Transcript_34576/g.62193 Transcript_34576/m.62193 type:complete len:389 (-) Transcript_34576:56-1222(-)
MQESGQHGAAEMLLRRALRSCEEGIGAWHPDALSVAQNLAEVLLTQHTLSASRRSSDIPGLPQEDDLMLREAEVLLRRSLTGRRAQLGARHRRSLRSAEALGQVLLLRAQAGGYKGQFRLREAEPLLYQALMGLNEDLGAEHPDALAVCASLGLCFQLQGQGLKAHLCYRHAVPRLQHWADAKWQHQQTEAPPKRFLGASVLGAASAAQNWAALLCETKPLPLQEASEAEDLYRWALAALHRELGAEHPSSLRVAGNLAQVVQARRPRKHFHLSKCPAEPSGEQVIPGQEEPEREPAVPAPAPKENEVQGPVQEEEALADEEVLLVSWPKDGRRNAWRGKAYDGCIRRRVLSCCPKGEKRVLEQLRLAREGHLKGNEVQILSCTDCCG